MTTMTTTRTPTDAFDPQAPYVGPDLVRYQTFGHFLASQAEDCPRNHTLWRLQKRGLSQDLIRIFLEEYDHQREEGEDHAYAVGFAYGLIFQPGA